MITRNRFEKDCRRLFSEYKYGTTIWSPLAGGILSGKYNDGNIPAGSRFDNHKMIDHLWQRYMSKEKDKTLVMLNKLNELAVSLGYTQPQLALAWAIANTDVSTCMLGFSRVSQVEENLKALELYKKWTPEIEAKVGAILGNDPDLDLDARAWNYMP